MEKPNGNPISQALNPEDVQCEMVNFCETCPNDTPIDIVGF
jgi:hypothetical protein